MHVRNFSAKNWIPIPFGHNCLIAHHLTLCGLRKISLPFDWLLIVPEYSLHYANRLINNNFKGFVDNLAYDGEYVISKNYPSAKFFHHDLIKNSADVPSRMDLGKGNLVDIFKRRASKFMEMLYEEPCFLISTFYYDYFKSERRSQLFWDSAKRLLESLNERNVDFQLLIVAYGYNHPFDVENLSIPESLQNQLIVRGVVVDQSVDRVFGCSSDFRSLFSEFFSVENVTLSEDCLPIVADV